MIFSYRTRRFFRRLLGFLAAAAAVGLVIFLCWLLWLQRYIRYTPEGAVLDFSLNQDLTQGVEAKPLTPGASVSIHYGDEEDLPAQEEPAMEQLQGYYVTVDELVKDLAAVRQKIEALPKGTAVLVDVKGTWGYFFYPTTVGDTTSESFNMAVMEAFFADINDLGLYTIARLPAFQDYDYGRKNYSCGLAVPAGYLWYGENHCYWLNPENDQVLTYLIDICRELRSMGFDEVVFKDFCFPDTDEIIYDGDRTQALNKAARTLVTACANTEFAVSFITSDPALTLPEGNCRLYLEGVAAADVADRVLQFAVPDPAAQLVFFAQTNDTRYEVSGVLRPLDMAY